MNRRPDRWKQNVSARALRKRHFRPPRGYTVSKSEQVARTADALLHTLKQFISDPNRPSLTIILQSSTLPSGYTAIPLTSAYKKCRDMWAARCPQNKRISFRKMRANLLNRLKQKKGCNVCGEHDFRCLDFHHIDPTTKWHSIARMKHYGRDSLKAELKKCQVICSNCHRKIQYRT